MSIIHSSSVVTSDLLLNLDFKNPKRFNASGTNLVTDYIYNPSTWGSYVTSKTTGIYAPDGSNNAVRVQCIKRYGTYTLTSNVATVTIEEHGLSSGNHQFDFTSGTGVNGGYAITVIDPNTFTIPVTAANGSGNVILYVRSGLRVVLNTFTPNTTDTYVISFWVRYNSGSGYLNNGLATDLQDNSPSATWTTLATSNPGKWVQVIASNVTTATAKTFVDLMSDTFGDYNIDFWGAKVENKTVNTYTTQLKDTIGGNTFDLRRTDYAVMNDSYVQFTRSTAANTTQTVTNYIANGTTTITCTVPSTTSLYNLQAINISGASGTEQTKLNGTWTLTIINSTTFTFVVSSAVAAGTYTTGLGTMTVSSKWGGLVISNPSMTGDLTYTNFAYNDHTWEVWFRIDDRNPSSLDSVEGYSILACYPGWHCGYLYSASTLTYLLKNGASLQPTCSSWTLGTSGTQIIQGNWYQIVVTRTGDLFTPYLNGVPFGTGTTTFTDPTNNGVTNNICLGGANNQLAGASRYMYYAKNSIGNMKMYKRALSAAEVAQNFNALRGRYGL